MTSAAASASALGASRAPGLYLLNQQVAVEFLRVDDELARRRRWGLAALPDRELLTALFGLPVDYPVPRAALTARQQRLLRRAPDGVVDLQRREVTRRLVPPIRVRHVTADAPLSIARLRQFSQFASFAPRLFVAHRGPSHSIVEEAARWGIGLVAADGTTILEGTPFVIRRHTPATWLFHEAVFSELLRVGPERIHEGALVG